MAKQQKRVQVIARYTIKRNGYVCYLVRSSNGEDTYCTTFDAAGHATGCSCPAKKPCYHMTQLQEMEAERQAMETERWSMEAARTPRQEYAPAVGGCYSFRAEPVSTQSVVSKAVQKSAAKRREYAALNGNRGFSLMR